MKNMNLINFNFVFLDNFKFMKKIDFFKTS